MTLIWKERRWSLACFFATYESDAVVYYSQISLGIMTICGVPEPFLFKSKIPRYILPQCLPADLNRYFSQHLLIMEQQRPKINPDPIGLQRSPDSIHVFEYIICSIQEEASSHSLEMLRPLGIYKGKLSTSDIELRFSIDLLSRREVRHSHTSE